jgi:autotransporter-associated beta strand protein
MVNIAWTGTTGDYGTASNWIGGTKPGSIDAGVFDATGITKTITLQASETVAGWVFDGGDYFVRSIGGGVTFTDLGGPGVQVLAGSVTIQVQNGGTIQFQNGSDGGNEAYIVDLGATLDFHLTTLIDRTVGSIAGGGTILIGADQLTVGGDNLSTAFTGSIQGFVGGSLVKVGSGTLTLTGSNNFGGGITLQGGTLELTNPNAAAGNPIVFALGSVDTLGLTLSALVGGHFTTPIDSIVHGDAVDLIGDAHTGGSPNLVPVGDKLTVPASITVTLDAVVGSPGAHYTTLSDHFGGTDVVPAIIATAPHERVDGNHHPAGQAALDGNGMDVIVALGANDTIRGLGGNDTMVGGAHGDVLDGGGPGDHFVFATLKASPPSHPEIIMHFSHAQHDKIDLYDLRLAVPGHQPLVFIGGRTFADYHDHHPHVFGLARYAGGLVEVNVNAHLTTEFAIRMHGAPPHLHGGDFVL